MERIDLASGERVDATFVSPRHESRESDVIWQFRRKDGGEPVYVYILLEVLAGLNSPVADLFRIETSRDWLEVRSSVHRLRQSIPPGEAALRQAFETWLLKVILPRLGLSQEEAAASTLEEIETMLAESIDRWNREIREEGRRQGRQEAFQEAIREGQAGLLLRQLRLKFGPLDPEAEERVRSADAERLLEWGDRILTAESLQDVFQG